MSTFFEVVFIMTKTAARSRAADKYLKNGYPKGFFIAQYRIERLSTIAADRHAVDKYLKTGYPKGFFIAQYRLERLSTIAADRHAADKYLKNERL